MRKVYYPGERWKKYAVCRGVGTEFFYASEYHEPKLVREAKKFCDICPVKDKCLEYSLFVGERGVWGGLSLRQRERISVDKRFVCCSGHDCRWNEDLVCYVCLGLKQIN